MALGLSNFCPEPDVLPSVALITLPSVSMLTLTSIDISSWTRERMLTGTAGLTFRNRNWGHITDGLRREIESRRSQDWRRIELLREHYGQRLQDEWRGRGRCRNRRTCLRRERRRSRIRRHLEFRHVRRLPPLWEPDSLRLEEAAECCSGEALYSAKGARRGVALSITGSVICCDIQKTTSFSSLERS